ncbi:MAG: hypothetical protein WAJ87_24135, partial [Bryobacteraceae bacterium]
PCRAENQRAPRHQQHQPGIHGVTHHAIRSRGDDPMAKLGLNADLPFEEGILRDRQVNEENASA